MGIEAPSRHAATFEAVRRQVFVEMHSQAKRWMWRVVVPFNLALVALFVACGGSPVRGAAMLVAIPIGHLPIVFRAKRGQKSVFPFALASLHYLLMMALTGGIASPLLPMGLPMVSASALVLTERRQKIALAVGMAIGFALLAWLSCTPIGAVPAPLGDASGAPTRVYLIALGGASAFAALGLLRSGLFVTKAYARVAEELAARREEACAEGADYSRALEGVAARLAHEVKNPLTAIKALSAHVARSSPDPKTAERLAIVAAEADRLQAIVDGFLSFSRGLGDLRVEPVRPYEIARELSVLLETRLSDQGLTMEVIGDEQLEPIADGRKLRQAMLNLVLNAMHASPRGAKITVAIVLTKDDVVRIRVIDHGAGMTKDVLERIRKPYYSTREGGSGLGVAVARAMVEQHGGELRFESTPGQGTTATIELPRVAAPPKQDHLPVPHVPGEDEASAPRARKLVG